MELLQDIRNYLVAAACLLTVFPMLFCLGAWLYTSPGVRRLFARLNRQFRSLPPFGKLLAIVFLATFIAMGSTKTNNASPRASPPSGIVFDGGRQRLLDSEEALARRLTTNQFWACFALVQTLTNASFALSVASNAVSYAPWTRYGVAEDTFWMPATNWTFILGTNAVEGLHVSSSGTISFGWPKGSPRAREMPDGSSLDFLAPLQTSIGIVSPAGRFWHAPTPSNSLLLTWQDVFATRDTNYPISFQSELFANGDFTFRYDLSRFPPTAHCQLPTANWTIGAQNNGGGETYAFADTNLLVNGLELRWRAFGVLDPGITDHDGDGLSTYDEVMIHGTDPHVKDSDLDGILDPDELAAFTDPCNPDSDGDGLADGIDPQPLVWNDPDADADNDGMGYLYEIMHGLDPAHDDSTDSDSDGWADWKELLAGTDPYAPASIPVDEDGLPGIFTVTFTLNADLPGPAVLTVGPHTLPLKQAGSRSLTLKAGTAYTTALYTMVPYTVKLSATFSDACATLIDPSGIFSGIFIAGRDAATALIALPVIVVSPSSVCFHESDTTNLTAVVTPALTGGYLWMWSNGDISDLYGSATKITWEGAPGESTLYLSFLAEGANQVRIRSCKVSKCSWVPGGTAYGPASEGVVPVNNDDDDASGVLDVAETSLAAGDDDLAAVQPIGSHSGDCCDCPEHKAIYGASADLQFCSSKLKIYSDTCKANAFGGTVLAGATVYVEGHEASTAVNAERLVWSWTDDNQVSRLITNAFTVLSLRLFGDLDLDGAVDVNDIALHSSLSEDHGWVLPTAPDVLRPVRLRTDVRLPGTFTFSLDGPEGAFRVWDTATPGTNASPLLVCGQGVTHGVGGANFADYGQCDLYVEALSNGVATLTYRYEGTGAADDFSCVASLKMTTASFALVPDYDRDGMIDDLDRHRATTGEVFRIWINDDKDVGDTAQDGGSDIPGQTSSPDHADYFVNGRRDLADFFPVLIDMHLYEQAFGIPDYYRVRQADEAVSVVYTSLGDINAGCHLTNDLQGCGAGLDTSLLKATVIPIPSGGFALPDVFTQRLRQTGGRGVILVEGTVASSEQLVLEAVANGQVLATATLPMRVAPVEEMYQRISLRGDGTSVATGDVLPPFDDSAGHVFFLHGFHVDTTVAREWGAEMFKRLWQSGSQARFHSITWDGDIGWPDGVHYHDDAVSAFQAAPRLAAYVDAQSGRKITMAHSLGNVVVSSAIQDDGMLVEKQFMFNAAVASEAFDPSQWSTAVSGNNMIHEEWTDYLPRTWSALYYQLFSPDVVFGEDGRYSLTWQGRFSGCVTNLYNYYSSGDEVFEQYAGTPNPTEGLAWHLGLPVLTGFERYCWQKQELYKGRDGMGELSGLFGTSLAGWGFELVSLMGEAPHPAYTATEANAFTTADLAETQCISFRRTPPEFFADKIGEADQRALLARAIPALSGAAGNTELATITDETRQQNMNTLARPSGWGRNHEDYVTRWLHGDLKNMAYFYIKTLFDDVVSKGELK